MDLLIKVAIAIFCISVLLIFFKVTKKFGANYTEKKSQPVNKNVDYEQLLNELEQEDMAEGDYNWEVQQ